MCTSTYRRFGCAVFTLVVATFTASAASAAELAPTHENVAYGPHERNVLDLWLAESDEPTPLVIFMHGGGFRRGDKEAARGRPVVSQCLEAGVSFAAMNYRFLEHTGLPGILRDAGRSIQFLRSRAGQWNIDPERIAIYGSSAGAGTSMWLAFHDDLADPNAVDPVLRQSSRPNVAGSLDGQVSYDLREWDKYVGPAPPGVALSDRVEFYGFAGTEEANTPEADRIMKDCAMIHLISADDPPVAIACAQPDGPSEDRGHYLHHPKHSVALAEQCRECHVECLLVLCDDTEDRAKQANSVVGFLIEKLKAAR